MRRKISAHSTRHDAFGRAVRETRARRGLSQEHLGFVAGLHRNYVGAVERGEINPTLRIVFKLADGLMLRPAELLQLAERQHEDATLLVGETEGIDTERPHRRSGVQPGDRSGGRSADR